MLCVCVVCSGVVCVVLGGVCVVYTRDKGLTIIIICMCTMASESCILGMEHACTNENPSCTSEIFRSMHAMHTKNYSPKKILLKILTDIFSKSRLTIIILIIDIICGMSVHIAICTWIR